MKKKIKSITLTPETHWDREWYLPFESYRAKLVLLIDQLLDILESDPKFKNWTFDGQTVVIQDYLEVRPEREALLTKHIKNGRISIGPMYILPDEYLVSGESMIRNLMLGHKIASKYGKPMKAGYIPDPFGHFAQLPQILSQFNILNFMAARGFGNEVTDLNLDMEFNWHAPGDAASIIGINLVEGYHAAANLSEKRDNDGQFKLALQKIEKLVKSLSDASATQELLLPNGSDHLFAQAIVPEVIEQWNATKAEEYAEIVQADLTHYCDKLVSYMDILKDYTGELHGGKYNIILSGVYSARMWIKQENWKVQNLLERYSEPTSYLNFLLTNGDFLFPTNMIWASWQKLLRNHPHDSICGCSIDEVHDIDMKARFFQAHESGLEIVKENLAQLASYVSYNENDGERIAVVLYNPLPWERSELIKVKIFVKQDFPEDIILESGIFMNGEGKEYLTYAYSKQVADRYTLSNLKTYEVQTLVDDIPAMGYKVIYYYPGEESESNEEDISSSLIGSENFMENGFYKVDINENGTFNLLEKDSGNSWSNLGYIEDCGDWGDEYDFSGPKEDQTDKVITNQNAKATYTIKKELLSIITTINVNLNLPHQLGAGENRFKRSNEIDSTDFVIELELPINKKQLNLHISWVNKSLDHRVRMVFPSGIITEEVLADGHFYVVPRTTVPPKDDDWVQKFVPTHHQNKFVLCNDKNKAFMVMNQGLPEYEAMIDQNKSISFAITMLRSIGWLSRDDFQTRTGNAGPPIPAPGAQCLGKFSCDLAITTSSSDWISDGLYRMAEDYHAHVQPASPCSINDSYRVIDAITLSIDPSGSKMLYSKVDKLPLEFSLFKLNNPNITMTALKKAEDDGSAIIRFVNMTSTPQSDKIKFNVAIEAMQIVDMSEHAPENSIKMSAVLEKNNLIQLTLEPHVIGTLKLNLKM